MESVAEMFPNRVGEREGGMVGNVEMPEETMRRQDRKGSNCDDKMYSCKESRVSKSRMSSKKA